MPIPRLHKEASIFDESDTIAGGLDAASQTAESYITEISAADGVKVHSAGDTSTFVQIASAFIDFVRGGVSALKLWVDGTAAKVRVGLESAGHSVFSPDGMEVFKGGDSVASFGETARIGKRGEFSTIVEDDRMALVHHRGVELFEVAGADNSATEKPATSSALAADTLTSSRSLYESIEALQPAEVHLAPLDDGLVFVEHNPTTHQVVVYLASDTVLDGSGTWMTAERAMADYPSDFANNIAYVHQKAMVNDTTTRDYIGIEVDAGVEVDYEIHRVPLDTTGYLRFGNPLQGGASGYPRGGNSVELGEKCVASADNAIAIGRYNEIDRGLDYAVIVGNGTPSNRSNAFTVDWNGNVDAAGRFDLSNTLATESHTKSYSAAANSGSGAVDITITKSGYTPIGIVGAASGSQSVAVVQFSLLNASTARCYFRNVTGTAQSPTASVTVLYRAN